MTSIYHLRFVEMSSFCLIATYLNVMTKSWTEHELLKRSLRRTLKLVFQGIIILQHILSRNQCKDIKLKVYNLFTNKTQTFCFVHQYHKYKHFMIELYVIISIIVDIKRT